MAMTSVVSTVEVMDVAMDAILPSPSNPRQAFDQAGLESLAASIKSVGVQVPISVRTVDSIGAYTIVDGERRWRAAKLVGLKTIPAVAREMTDEQFREMQLIANLQRVDLSPMEEAAGYEQIIREAALGEGREITDEQLAQKVGKTVAHVRSRRKLLDLIAPARAALAEGYLTFGAALLIAKLLPADQDKATAYALYGDRNDSAEYRLNEVREEEKSLRQRAADFPDEDILDDAFRPRKESDIRSWIADNLLADLLSAPWPLDSETLLPSAGSCTLCPKRSGMDQALFSELTAKSDLCTDPSCYGAKRDAFVQLQRNEAANSGKPLLQLSTALSYMPIKPAQKTFKRGQWVQAKPDDACAQKGVTEDGDFLTVCIDPQCKTHKHMATSAPSSPSGSGVSKSAPKVDYEAQRRERERKEKAYLEAEWPVRLRVWAAIKPRYGGATLLRHLAIQLASNCDVRDFLRVLGAEPDGDLRKNEKMLSELFVKAKPAELEGILASLLVTPIVAPKAWRYDAVKQARSPLWRLGSELGIDCDRVALDAAVSVKKETAAKTKAKPAPKPSAKPSPKPVAKPAAKPAAKKKAGRK